MKQKQLIDMILQGGQYFVGEFRATNIDHVQWRDKETGKQVSGDFVKHTVECGSKTIIVNERLPEGVAAASQTWPFKKGDKVAVRVEAMETNKGLSTVRGKLEVIERD